MADEHNLTLATQLNAAKVGVGAPAAHKEGEVSAAEDDALSKRLAQLRAM